MVLCSSFDGVPLKINIKISQASSWAVLIVWAYFRPLLDFARQYLLRLLSVNYKYSPRIERGEIYFYMYFLSLMAIKRTDTNAFLSEKLLWVVLTKKIFKVFTSAVRYPSRNSCCTSLFYWVFYVKIFICIPVSEHDLCKNSGDCGPNEACQLERYGTQYLSLRRRF